MMKYKVAVVQYDVPDTHEKCLNKMEEILKYVKKKDVKLIVFPETALSFLANVKKYSENTTPILVDLAKKYQIHLSLSIYKKEKDKFVNQGLLISDSGDILIKQNKIYLAPPERDNDGITSGNDIKVSNSNIGNLGMLICKDSFNKYSHFIYEKFNDLKVNVITIPTWSLGIFPVINEFYVQGLITYGSFISRAFVLVSGNLNKETKSFGKAMIVDPELGVIAMGSNNKEEILIKEIDISRTDKLREFDTKWQAEKRVI